jgi:CubicO group peptidase (beta-lactamase class C family)
MQSVSRFIRVVEERMRRAIRERVFPGCVVGCVRANGERDVRSFGHITYEDTSARVMESTVYDTASITKSIPTASLALTLMAEGKLRPEDRVTQYLLELQNDFDATIEDLLTYRVRVPRLSLLKDKTADEILAYVFAHGFDGPPNEPQYANLPALLLGIIIERVSGETLDHLAQKTFFSPLGMVHTTFFPKNSVECAPTEIVGGEEVRGIVHDESARVFAMSGRAVGHAGLFSTAPDILNFLQMLLEAPLSPLTEDAQKGFGWQSQGEFLGMRASPKAFGKTGFTGTSCVVDIERGIAFVILSNRTYPKRPLDTSAINAVRRDIADILLG